MDFGKNLLEKYGWKEGSGLGKNNDGITKPLKANLKFDKAGFGEDKSKEFTNHWWDRAFNEAARNIDVSKEGGNVTIGVKDKDSVEITTKSYSSKGKAPSQNGYNNFIKKSVLSGSRETREESSGSEPEEPDLPKYKTLSYDELFEACGGLTAHKGARHGLTLSGKLNRIEQQEQELLAKFEKAEQYLTARNWPYAPLKKQSKRPALEAESAESVNSDKFVEEHMHTTEYHRPSKKKNKKDKKDDDELAAAVDSSLETVIRDVMLPKPKKKRKKETADECTQTWISESVIPNNAKKEKFKKMSTSDNSQNKIKKKKKLKKFADKSTMI